MCGLFPMTKKEHQKELTTAPIPLCLWVQEIEKIESKSESRKKGRMEDSVGASVFIFHYFTLTSLVIDKTSFHKGSLFCP